MSVVGFWEKACAALLALAAFVTTPPTITADEDVAVEVVTEVAAVVVACGAAVDENAEAAELDAMLVAVLDEKAGELGVDDGGIVLDEAMLLGVVFMFDGVLEATLLLGVAVAVQNS